MSSLHKVEPLRLDMDSVISGLLGEPVTSIEMVGGGRNSQIYKVTDASARTYVVKYYFRHPLAGRDRLEAECSSLEFLWNAGIKDIPRPIAVDKTAGCAVYEYIEGEAVPSGAVTSVDIDAAVTFLSALKALRERARSRVVLPASEACCSVQAILETIERRLSRLPTSREHDDQLETLHAFLRDAFIPAFSAIAQWCRDGLERRGLPVASELPEAEQTLSPSDFGFHNALRRRDGGLVFVDFEHFGWDDPAKMIADFLLHPAMELSEALKQRFVDRILECFCEQTQLADRLAFVYPLFGLKWCMILLNEFVPQDLLRRGFAQRTGREDRTIQAEQLVKAKRMLRDVMQTYERFPYTGH